jgi:hypothetical protein
MSPLLYGSDLLPAPHDLWRSFFCDFYVSSSESSEVSSPPSSPSSSPPSVVSAACAC